MARPEDVPVARVSLGQQTWQSISIYGWPASELGIPGVEVRGALEDITMIEPETADRLAAGLMLAARVARGEVLPTALDQFLEKRKA